MQNPDAPAAIPIFGTEEVPLFPVAAFHTCPNKPIGNHTSADLIPLTCDKIPLSQLKQKLSSVVLVLYGGLHQSKRTTPFRNL